jgi:hypothetical protein
MIEPQSPPKRRIADSAVFLFGPLALSFDGSSFNQLRSAIVRNEEYGWIRDVITSLPLHWKTIVAAIPGLKVGAGLENLEALKAAFTIGQSLKTDYPLPNTLLIPLVISLHLIEYASFTKHINRELDICIDTCALSKDGQETLGLCTGLLSSLAVSCAGNKEQFQKYAAVAIRLGLLTGMVVDAHDERDNMGPSKSISTAWNSVDKAAKMRQILKDFPHVSQRL